MRTIHTLPDSVVSKIAAGEVIERPVYAIKELIENAIDAQSSTITIHLEDSGLKKLIVADNGIGMSKEDVELSYLPHTTSKIHHEDDLTRLETLGFRGEALSSLASISQLKIQSKKKTSKLGYFIQINYGEKKDEGTIGMPSGTIISASQLFSSIPARKKFLKSSRTELRLIIENVLQFALLYPKIHFTLTNNEKNILDLPIKESFNERLRTVFGNSFKDRLFPIHIDENFIKGKGFIGHPLLSSKYNLKQFIFINKRIVSDKKISLAVKEAFGTLLPAQNTPVFILDLEVPKDIIDVNIHPRKETISFISDLQYFETIKSSILETLNKFNITFHMSDFKSQNSSKSSETKSFIGELLRKNVLTPMKNNYAHTTLSNELFQVNNTYIIASDIDSIIIFDQHAAHERILYERFLSVYGTKKKNTQSIEITTPIQFEFSPTDALLLQEHIELFKEMGFVFDHFQAHTYTLRKIPEILKGRKIEKIIKDVLADIESEKGVTTLDLTTQRLLAFLACRAAVKSGDELHKEKMKEIIESLNTTPHNATCPHGRPTKIYLPFIDIDHMFGRK